MIQRWFDTGSDWIEHLLSTWYGVAGYGAICIACYAWSGWDALDRWVYMSGAGVVILLIGAGRRDSKATHAKLDALTPGHDLNRLEERREDEIERARPGHSHP